MIYVLLVILIYVSAVAYMYFFQDKFIFFPVKLPQNYVFSELNNTKELFFKLGKTTIHGLHFSPPIKTKCKGAVLYLHGNSRAVNYWGQYAVDFTERGYEVYMLEYRGFGKSTGNRNQENMIADALLFYLEIRKKFEDNQIIICGRSMGSGVASHLANITTPKAVILETPYYSLLRLVRKKTPFLPIGIILKYPFRSDLCLPNIKCPIYIFHGTSDKLIPYQHAKELASLSENARLITIPEGLHQNLSTFERYQKYLEEILK